MGHAGFEMAVDLMFGDQVFDQRLGVFAQRPEPLSVLHAQHLLKRVLIHPLAAAQLPAIAA